MLTPVCINLTPIDPLDGIWGAWSPWAVCSVSCGGGNQARSRECNSPPPANGGRDCEGTNTSTETCGNQGCPVGKHDSDLV